MTTVTLSTQQLTILESIADRAVGHFEGVPTLFVKEYLPTIVTVEVGTDANGQPCELKSIDPDVFTASLANLEAFNKARAERVGTSAATATGNFRQYKKRIIERVTAAGIAVPSLEEEQAAVTAKAAANAEVEAFAADAITNGTWRDALLAELDAGLATADDVHFARATAIVRNLKRTAKAARKAARP